VQVFQKAWNLLSDDVKASLQRAESNLNALNTFDLGPKRPFSVGECALWARLAEPQFAAQVAAAVSLVEALANHFKASTVANEVMAIKYSNQTGLSIQKLLEAAFAGKHPKLIKKGTKAAAAEAAMTAAEAIAVVDLEEAKRLAAEFEAMGGGALTMAIAQKAEPGDHLRKCWLAHERLPVSEARSINHAEILTARTGAAAEVAEVSAAEAAAAKAAAAVEAAAAAEAAAAVESAAAAGAAAKAAADAPGAEAALSPELPKEPGGGADGMAEDAEEIPGRPEELKTRGGSFSSEGANAAAQAERSTPIKLMGSLQQRNVLISNAVTTLNLSSEFIFMVIYPHSTISKSSPVDRNLSRSPNSNFK